ncbi:MAG: hypothetical protein GKS02_07005 [Alphaproteobacteria bacterium]|nr:hypothetical protein [Alphaproteobacteria bacterium]
MCASFDRTVINWPLEIVARLPEGIDSEEVLQLVNKVSSDHADFWAILSTDSAAILIGGCDERQLNENAGLFQGRVSGDIDVGKIHIGYRETFSKPVEIDYTHKKHTFGNIQYARLKIITEPQEDYFGFEFDNRIEGRAIPQEFVTAIAKGIDQQRSSGVIRGFPTIGVKVSLVDGKCHERDSSAMAFEIAARAAFRQAQSEAGIVLLEPIIEVVVDTPKDCASGLVQDLKSRRSTITGMSSEDDKTTIVAGAPVSLMFGFADVLAELTQDRGSYTVRFSHYESVHGSPEDDPLWTEPVSAALRA